MTSLLFSAIFYLLAAVIVVATGLAVTRKNLVHAAVYLAASFFATAPLFYLLGAPLLAAFEIIIYAGAVMVLFLFIIMTVGNTDPPEALNDPKVWRIPAILGGISLVAVGILVFADPAARTGLEPATASPIALGEYVFTRYWFAVEIVSFLLFVGLVGAIYLGKKRPEKNGLEENDSAVLGGEQP